MIPGHLAEYGGDAAITRLHSGILLLKLLPNVHLFNKYWLVIYKYLMSFCCFIEKLKICKVDIFLINLGKSASYMPAKWLPDS